LQLSLANNEMVVAQFGQASLGELKLRDNVAVLEFASGLRIDPDFDPLPILLEGDQKIDSHDGWHFRSRIVGMADTECARDLLGQLPIYGPLVLRLQNA